MWTLRQRSQGYVHTPSNAGGPQGPGPGMGWTLPLCLRKEWTHHEFGLGLQGCETMCLCSSKLQFVVIWSSGSRNPKGTWNEPGQGVGKRVVGRGEEHGPRAEARRGNAET